MALSSDLISQFVKITRDDTKNKTTESTAYGTAVVTDNTVHVRLDGSEILTPVSTTTNVKDGERVTVMIKNHAAIITGNISSPAARTEEVTEVSAAVDGASKKITNLEVVVADKVSTGEFSAVTANIQTLLAEDAVIRGRLEASEADISNLKAKDAEISGTLTAANANIEKLQTEKLSADYADIINATVEDLEATNAIVYNLDTVYATIESLNATKANIDEVVAKKLDAETAKITYATIENLDSNVANINTLLADKATIAQLNATNAEINNVKANYATVENLNANVANINTLLANKLDVNVASATYATIKTLESDYATIKALNSELATIDTLLAQKATIKDLEATNAEIDSLGTKYANIDFSNISKATMEEFYANSGLIKDVTIGDGTITGELVGVTIKGDLIEAGTLVADKLVILGDNGLYYKLNTNGESVEAQQTDYNSLNGSIITAKSITANKIKVEDLVAFGATIGGFHITESAIYSGVKETVGNTTRGIYLDNTGQAAFGDNVSFIKYYKDTDGKYKIAISADSILFGSSRKSIDTLDSAVTTAQNGVNGLSTRMSNAELEIEANAEAISATMTRDEVEQTLGGYYTISQTDAKIKASADSVTSSVSATYATKTALDDLETDVVTNYATKTYVTQTADSITSTVSKTYATVSALNNVDTKATNAGNAAAAAQDDIDALSDNVTQNYATKSEVTQTANSIKSTVSATYATKTALNDVDTKATNAATTASNTQDSLSRFTDHVQTTYATKSEVEQTEDSITSSVSATYATKSALSDTDTKATNAATAAANAQDDVDDLASDVSTNYATKSYVTQTANSITSSVSATYATKDALSDTDIKAANALSAAGDAQDDVDALSANVTKNYATKSEVTQTANSIKSTVSQTYATKQEVEDIEIGSRNLLKDSNAMYECTNTSTHGTQTSFALVPYDLESLIDKTLTFSYYVHCPGTRTADASSSSGQRFGMHGCVVWANSSGNTTTAYPFADYLTTSHDNERVSMQKTLTPPSGYDILQSISIACQPLAIPASDNSETWKIGLPMLEVATKASEWSPAPEDADADIEGLRETVDTQSKDILDAESQITQLADNISMLVVDGDGKSLMDQTSTGWSFNLGNTNTAIANAESLANEAKNNAITAGQRLDQYDDYIKFTTYEEKPCIELGESSSDFKLRITNEEIQFLEGDTIPAYVNNEKLMIEDAQVKDELIFAREDSTTQFIWQIRDNGNMGLSWKGASN